MKKKFSGFYSPSNVKVEDAWKDKKTLFIFDTNVLLNLYSYTEDARNDFFKILDVIRDQVWIPHHVGLEYQRNRLQVIKNEKQIFKQLKDYIKTIEQTIANQKYENLKLDRRFPDLHKKSNELHENIQKLLGEFEEDIEVQNKKQPDVRSGDKIRKKLEKYFNNKVGEPFSEQSKLDEIYSEGKKRYENDIPPGYKDAKSKKEDKDFIYEGLYYKPMYGDFIIWKQIIGQVKDSEIKSVFFITDDIKEDWWYIIDSSGEKRIGVRAELRAEIEKEANISLFEIMTTSSFMEEGKKYLDLDVSKDSIDEIEEKSHRVTIKLDKSEIERFRNVLNDKSLMQLLNSSIREGELAKQNLEKYSFPNLEKNIFGLNSNELEYLKELSEIEKKKLKKYMDLYKDKVFYYSDNSDEQ